MKIKRFLALFLLLTLLMAIGAMPTAYAVSDPDIQAKAALLVDAETGAIAYAKNEHQELYPASLTKVMTALLVLNAIDAGKLDLKTELTATATALSHMDPGGSTANIKVGEVMSVESLLYCMLVVSANEACDVLAEAVAGSVEDFVTLMNEKAAELGCVNTHFANPNGLHDPQHYTSAWDLYLITKAAMEYPIFMTICDTADITIPATNMSEGRRLITTNHLLSNWRVIGYRNKDAHGIKTGSTEAAGHCLISSATKGELHFVSVIMGADRVEENGVGNIRSFSETTRMFQYGFENFRYQNILEEKEIIQEVPVTLSKTDYVTVHPANDLNVLCPKDLNTEDLQYVVTLTDDSVQAPVQAGQKLGELTLQHDGIVYGTVNLVASNDVEADRKMVLLNDIQQLFHKTVVRVILVVLIVLALLLVLFFLATGSRRRRYGRGSARSYRSNYRGRRR